MVVAETMSIDGEVVALIIGVLLLIGAGAVTVAVLGCMWAYQWGRGSQGGRIGAIVVAAMASPLVLIGVATGEVAAAFVSLVPWVAQAVAFKVGRGRGPYPPEPPPGSPSDTPATRV